MGGVRGAILGSFVNGLLISFMPILLIPVLGDLGLSNATFSDSDFGIVGLFLSGLAHFGGNYHYGWYWFSVTDNDLGQYTQARKLCSALQKSREIKNDTQELEVVSSIHSLSVHAINKGTLTAPRIL